MKFLTILAILTFSFIGSNIFGQSIKDEKPKLKFGWSLKDKAKRSDYPKNPPAIEDEDLIKIETDLVVNEYLVLDRSGKFVSGLKAEDFEIFEDGAEQEIEVFSLGTDKVPRSIVLIIDYSGSQKPYIQNSVAAAKVLIEQLEPQDEVAIVTDDVKLLVDFTSDKALLNQTLDKLARTSRRGNLGKSQQYTALWVSLKELFDEEDLRPIIILQSDGDERASIPRVNDYENKRLGFFAKPFSINELFDRIERSKATIYSVISGPSFLGLTSTERVQKKNALPKEYRRPTSFGPEINVEQVFEDQTSMVAVASASGGFASALETPDQAAEIYEKMLGGITNRYLIGYYPQDQSRNGKQRRIQIKVKDHPEYTFIGRKSYFAPE